MIGELICKFKCKTTSKHVLNLLREEREERAKMYKPPENEKLDQVSAFTRRLHFYTKFY